MSTIFDHNDYKRHRLFNGPQIDPTRRAKKRGHDHYASRNRSRILMPDDFLPLGPHAGKHLRAVPVDYLLWVNQQPWAAQWSRWQPVADYISRFLVSDPETPPTADIPVGPVIFVDEIQQYPGPTARCFRDGSCHLHTLPGFLDLLQTFAIGALDLDPDWLQHKTMPHFDLTKGKRELALQHGAQPVDRRQVGYHIRRWREFRDSRPQPTPDPSTHTRIKHQFP